MNALDTLKERGFVHQTTDERALYQMLERSVTCYTGFDPTGPSLTVGHLVPIMMLAHLQRHGHRPIILCGGGTAMVGDPSGKTESRPILSPAQIQANLEAQRRQLMSFLDFTEDRAFVVNNADWLSGLNYIEFLRDFGRLFSVNQMLTAEIYRTRLDNNDHLSFLEFNYQLLQAYDFLHLYREYGCTLQAAGSDQWANCLAGADLIRRLEGAETQVLCAPLLLTADGRKMGKTERGSVMLSAELTPPYDFYQYWINVDDRDVEPWLKLFTFLDLAEISDLCAAGGAALNQAKRRLAYEVTARVHGAAAADEAKAAAEALFGGAAGESGNVPSTPLPTAKLAGGYTIVDALVDSGLCKSRGDARRKVDQGGAYLNDERIDSIERQLAEADVQDGGILLRLGKKKYHRLVVE